MDDGKDFEAFLCAQCFLFQLWDKSVILPGSVLNVGPQKDVFPHPSSWDGNYDLI